MLKRAYITGTLFLYHLGAVVVKAQATEEQVKVNQGPGGLNFAIPTFSDLLTFLIRFFFFIAGLAALIMMLWGALTWVTSGGEKEGVEKARDKIVAAIVGVIMIVVALAIIWSMEQIVFQGKICFGLSCPVTLPALLK